MFSAHSRLATVFFVSLASFFAASASHAQTRAEYASTEASNIRSDSQPLRENCAFHLASSPTWAHFAIDTESRAWAKESGEGRKLSAAPGIPCADANFTPPAEPALRSANVFRSGVASPIGISRPADAIALQLTSLGKLGVPLARARAEVLAILESDNACTEWLAAKDPTPADTFRSLTFSIDRDGQEKVFESNAGDALRYYRQPYVARATQDGGANTGITVNANGAFYREQGTVELLREDGGPLRMDGARLLTVGAYLGSTLEAQMVTLLHEFGHVIDLLPEDADNLDGRSVRNTDEVLRHCRPEIDTRSKSVRQSAKR
jgi:hypothetical protein